MLGYITEWCERVTQPCGSEHRRAKQEYVREELRDANQARGRGSQMGGPEGGLASVNDTEWLSEVRAGRKKAAVLRDAEKVFQVSIHMPPASTAMAQAQQRDHMA